MKILIVLRDSPDRGILVRLRSKTLQNKVRSLVDNADRPAAMVTALIKGSFEEEVFYDVTGDHDADLILSEERTSWTVDA